jgi:hypothetical protein
MYYRELVSRRTYLFVAANSVYCELPQVHPYAGVIYLGCEIICVTLGMKHLDALVVLDPSKSLYTRDVNLVLYTVFVICKLLLFCCER